MRMGDDKADQPIGAFGKPSRIGAMISASGNSGAPEADAAIDGQQGAVAAVDVEVHADLAGSAQGQEGQIAGCRGHGVV